MVGQSSVLEQALVPATHSPAGILGLRKGHLAAGYNADVVLLYIDLRPALTPVEGEIVFERGSEEQV